MINAISDNPFSLQNYTISIANIKTTNIVVISENCVELPTAKKCNILYGCNYKTAI